MRFAMIPLDISDFPTRHNYGLGLWQNHIERILADWVGELAVPIYRGREVTGFAQDDTGVDVALSDGQSLRAEYLVGCDGGRSLIRKAAGIEFPGWDPTIELADRRSRDGRGAGMGLPPRRPRHPWHRQGGEMASARPGRADRTAARRDSEPTLRDISEALIAVYGTDYGIHSPTWISRFTDMTRQAAAYRDRRVLLAGDAAHVHPPVGGQGLNIGVQDAVNLGWKLAQVVKRTSPESLLDTYHAERHPVAARVLRNTMAQVALRRTDDRTKALGDTVSELLGMDEPRRRFAARCPVWAFITTSARDTRCSDAACPISTWSPPTARCGSSPCCTMPGRCCSTSVSPAASTSRHGRIGSSWSTPDTMARGSFRCSARSLLPTAVLIRPDGYVAWVGDLTQLGLADALTTWFGPGSDA